MPIPAAIQGVTGLLVGNTLKVTDTTPAGTWSSDNTAVATIDSSGLVTGIAAGTANIIYTIDGNSIAAPLTVTLNTITNGLNFTNVYNALQNRVLWQSQGINSLSGRYFEDFHPLCNTTVLNAIRPQDGSSLTTYLANKQRSVIMEVLQAMSTQAQLIDPAQLCFQRPDVMIYPQPVTNVGQFVGIKMLISPGQDIAVKFNSVELFFDSDVTFPMYLYNDMTLPPIYKIMVSAKAQQQVIVDLSTNAIMNYLSPSVNKQGIWYFGYYQNDVIANNPAAHALYYSIYNTTFHGAWLMAFSAPTMIDAQGNTNFQRNNIGANNLTYGLNIEMSVMVDNTNNLIQNASLFDEVTGLAMAVRVVSDIVYNYQTNSVQSAIGGTSVNKLNEQLEGYRADEGSPYIMGLRDKMNRAIKTAKAGFQKKPGLSVGVSGLSYA